MPSNISPNSPPKVALNLTARFLDADGNPASCSFGVELVMSSIELLETRYDCLGPRYMEPALMLIQAKMGAASFVAHKPNVDDVESVESSHA